VSSSSRKPGQYTIGSRAVAVAIMSEILQHATELADAKHGRADAPEIADELVGLAWDVEYKPHAERLVLVVDAGISSERTRPELAHEAPAAEEAPAEPAGE
jgi:hypothetical protein